MMSLILTIAMTPAAPAPRMSICEWPRKCLTAAVAPITICEWPRKCVEAAPIVAPKA